MHAFRFVIAGGLGIWWALVAASPEIPLFWNTVQVTTEDRGGATVEAAVDGDGELEILKVTIRDHDIQIPTLCLAGLTRPLLNEMSVVYGQFDSGQSYWSLQFPFDGTGSVEFGAIFYLIFSERELIWSYKSTQIDDRTWEDQDVCAIDARTQQSKLQ